MFTLKEKGQKHIQWWTKHNAEKIVSKHESDYKRAWHKDEHSISCIRCATLAKIN